MRERRDLTVKMVNDLGGFILLVGPLEGLLLNNKYLMPPPLLPAIANSPEIVRDEDGLAVQFSLALITYLHLTFIGSGVRLGHDGNQEVQEYD